MHAFCYKRNPRKMNSADLLTATHSICLPTFKLLYRIGCTNQCSKAIPRILFLLVFLFCLFAISWAAPAAYGGSQARDQIGAVAAGLHHSHSNVLFVCLFVCFIPGIFKAKFCHRRCLPFPLPLVSYPSFKLHSTDCVYLPHRQGSLLDPFELIPLPKVPDKHLNRSSPTSLGIRKAFRRVESLKGSMSGFRQTLPVSSQPCPSPRTVPGTETLNKDLLNE